MFLSYHIFVCKIYCSCHQLDFPPCLLNYVFPDINAPSVEENHILGSPLLWYFIFLWCPDENKSIAYYKNQSYSAFDGLI